jgi:alpha-glucuronidase
MKKFLCVSIFCALSGLLHAEDGHDAWLRYAPMKNIARSKYTMLPAGVVAFGNTAILSNAREEMIRGIRGMLGRTLRISKELPNEPSIVLGTVASLNAAAPELAIPRIGRDGFWLANVNVRGVRCLVVTSPDESGVLYGVFALLGKIAREQNVELLNEVQQPYAPIRWVDHWDSLNGTIERSYAGPSVFFENDNVRSNLSRVSEYGRLLASIGIHGITINNVNANPRVIQDEFLPQLARIADAFRPCGGCGSQCR